MIQLYILIGFTVILSIIIIKNIIKIPTNPSSTQQITTPSSTQLITNPSTTQLITNPPTTQLITNPPTTQLITNPPTTQLITNPPTTQLITNPPSTSTQKIIPIELTSTNTKIFEKFVNETYFNKKDSRLDNVPLLVDFSYAGYKNSEEDIKIINTTRFNVLDYGADKTGTEYSTTGIQLAINAAATNGGGIVYFPNGTYKISSNRDNHDDKIYIRSSNIVLQGENKEKTIIYMDVGKITGKSWLFNFLGYSSADLYADVTQDAARGSSYLTIDNTNNYITKYKKGDTIKLSIINTPENLQAYFDIYFKNVPLNPNINLEKGYSSLYSMYEVDSVDIATNTIKIKGALHTFVLANRFKVSRPYKHLENCGIENLTFKGATKYLNWKGEPMAYYHFYGSSQEVKNNVADINIKTQLDMLHNAGWMAVQFNFTKNCWVRNCIHDSLSQFLTIEADTRNHTMENILVIGTKTHACITTKGTNHLINNVIFKVILSHGPSLFGGANGIVIKNVELVQNQCQDNHGWNPFSNLIDNVKYGVMKNYGGAEPNHGRWYTVWNFLNQVDGTTYNYDFWLNNGFASGSICLPIIIGMGANVKSVIDVEYVEKLNDTGKIYPVSLFDAQLKLRLFKNNINRPSIYITNPVTSTTQIMTTTTRI